MKTIRYNFADKPTLVEGDEPLPTLGKRDVLIRVHASSLNYRDQAVLDQNYGGRTEAVVPVSDGAGEVVAVGEDVTRTKVGDRVAASCFEHWIGGPYLHEYQSSSLGFTHDGWLAEHVALHENAIVHLPDYLSYVEGASLACAAVTAWTALNRVTPIQPGQTVLVQGTGGVSLFSLQIARMVGARVFAITSSDEKAEKLKELGAEAVVNYSSQPDWDVEILKLTDGVGVDRLIDIAGEKTIVKSAASTKIGGEIALVGFASGVGGGIPPIDILSRSLTIGGTSIGSRLNFEALLAAMSAHQMKPVIDQVFPFAEYRDAYQRLASGAMVGKVIIDMNA
ncbi:zinc-dependent alcohol dehydrogenase family protein [Sinorhizobium meliloti]|uniref:zinc-dependent alcohol dehydrogenase family protein n=1 Tax=Rhizobium meliloti TaxID=382 RepID=UPI000FDC0DE9|nr:NAD(P)-dependent alcohol dehydrogenase [Sinorhizobium meliloti]RVG72773.1 NAD(P)-dependent alcohol dehydrogenase [Sinorhizobium meliloti]RVH39530.1 NAD(P)-dependent alcohol dehydrogenase [Sinorhizobium meliloti]RVO62012.1 NAD(P)-dependent alcohol dehydrogenase [Sinorhizobium meliloti]